MAPNSESPFIHHHTENEGCYMILEGDGRLYADDEYFKIEKGSVFKMSPSVKRAFRAGDKGFSYICIQAKEGSLNQFTFSDGKLDNDSKPKW